MEKQTRNLIQKATQDARKLLESEFGEQLEGIFDILPDGYIAALPGEHLDARERIIREKIVAAIEHEKAGGISDAEGVAHYLREAAFTCLNRFVALKMLEARELVQECVSKGEQSPGFREFCGLAPGLAELPDKGYRLYIESLFDELSTEIRVLFDRRDLASLLWPRRKAFEGLLDILNREELAGVWGEDETIGWVYQYFNSTEERKKMREESAAPRNSRELAVRNQFFTPRYVVEFLTDNTLGRIWYEMRQGNTRLKEEFRYLVRRPNEIFLGPGKNVPKDDEQDSDLSQEELLKKPVYIEHRPKKDPRDIKILDPACGSGHFLLYAFDLLEKIYEEAWADEEFPGSERTGKSIRVDYPALKNLQRYIPKLIIENNLYGIDIDHRAVQIAALSLWMRAQRSWKKQEIKADERPGITKSNIVTAEPMPGEEEMRKEFIAHLNPRLLGQLVETVFEKMELAGEAGALLKIEEEIKDAVAEAKRQWLEVPILEQQSMFPVIGAPKPRQLEIQFDVKSIADEDFWSQVEERILDALREYSKNVQNGHALNRRLFAEDAERGFAFIDICRKRYDVVLMNPPYGAGSEASKTYLASAYPSTWIEVYIAFCERTIELCDHGFIGAITSRSFMYLKKFIQFRIRLLNQRLLVSLSDLGGGILDDAAVETAAWIFTPLSKIDNAVIFFDLENAKTKGDELKVLNSNVQARILDTRIFVRDLSSFDDGGNCSISYESSGSLRSLVRAGELFYTAKPGLGTRDDFRFARLRWEVGARQLQDKSWICAIYGSQATKFYADHNMVINWIKNGFEMKTFISAKYGSASRSIINEGVYFKPGLTYQYTGKTFRVHLLPKDCIITMAGQGLYPFDKADVMAILAILNSSYTTIALKEINPGRFFQASYVNTLRLRPNWKNKKQEFQKLSLKIFDSQRRLSQINETSPIFNRTLYSFQEQEISQYATTLLQEIGNYFDELDKITASYFEVSNEPDFDSEVSQEVPVYNIDLSLVIGFLFGRWDPRIELDPLLAPKLPDAFDPLPVCPPGMLVGPKALPAQPNQIVSEEWLRVRPDANTLPPEGSVENPTILDSEYLIRISWDGILVDDPGFGGGQLHQEDIIRRTREVLNVLWKDKAQDIEQEACDILKIPGLRTYFRKSFFPDHIKRYSKSRRKAPIYWQLATPSASYSVWLYYHRFTKDTFYKLLNEYIDPKLEFEERELLIARQQYGQSPTATQRKEIAARETFVAELITFKEEAARIAPLWNPNLNDGVIINFALLWRLVPQNKSWQRECKKIWDKLVKGVYDWAHLAMHLWPERVVPKCTQDRSLAIAHELDETLWEEDKKGKWHPRKITKETLEALIQERTSITVKAALEELVNAPVPAGATRKKRKRKT